MRKPSLAAVVVVLSMAAGFALRVIPAYQKVFSRYGVEFQENDAWFHMRTVHNQIAHFPRRSGFDPYAIYPGGQDIPTGPVWDWMIASSAWLAGFGAPSAALVDRVGAWLPAVLGALFPLIAFFLARSLAGGLAGMFAAWSVAVMPGAFLWLTQLGLADHHAAESFFALSMLTAMCMAVTNAENGRVRRAAWLTLAGGASLGALLGTRPAGAFIIVIFILTALVPNRTLAAVTLGVLAVGALLFVPVGSLIWSNYTWLLLTTGMVVMGAALALDAWWRRRNWPAAALPVLLAAFGTLALLFTMRWKPTLLASLWANIQRITGAADGGGLVATVHEMRPLLHSATSPVGALLAQLGLIWIVAIPALGWILIRAIRQRRPAWTLFAMWSLVMTAAGFAQLRMVVYYGPIAAILCALVCAAIVEALPARLRLTVGLILGAGIAVADVPFGVARILTDAGPTRDWVQAMDWIRENTPEPMGDASAYTRYYPRLGDRRFHYPSAAYGIAVWWDYGYLLMERGRRIPSSNGTQAGAGDTAEFYSATDPGRALETLRGLGARYALADPTMVVFDFSVPTAFDAIVQWSGRPLTAYYRVVYSDEDGQWRPMVLYLPDYFRSMAVRMYLFDGRPAGANGAWVVSTARQAISEKSGTVEVLRWKRRFDSEKEARDFMDAPSHYGMSAQTLTLASLDTSETCVDLPAVDGLRMVFNSDPGPIRRGHLVRAVKVFEVAP